MGRWTCIAVAAGNRRGYRVVHPPLAQAARRRTRRPVTPEAIIAQITLSVVSAFVGAFLGTRRFVREKTWEARNTAYRQLVEAIHKIHYWAEQHYADIHFLPTVGAAKFKELAESNEAAREELWRYATIGELMISSRATEIIRDLRNELEQAAHWYEEDRNPENERESFAHYTELVRSSVNKFLPQLVTAAKRDLRG